MFSSIVLHLDYFEIGPYYAAALAGLDLWICTPRMASSAEIIYLLVLGLKVCASTPSHFVFDAGLLNLESTNLARVTG